MQNSKFFVFVYMYAKNMKIMIMINYTNFYPYSKIKKIKTDNTLNEKYTDISEIPDFSNDYWSRTAEGVYKIGHDSFRLMKWLA